MHGGRPNAGLREYSALVKMQQTGWKAAEGLLLSVRKQKTIRVWPGTLGICTAVLAVAILARGGLARGDTNYYRHTFFDNSITRDAYFYSHGRPSAPSTLEVIDEKLPVDLEHFYTPPNALRLKWQSAPGGGWDA